MSGPRILPWLCAALVLGACSSAPSPDRGRSAAVRPSASVVRSVRERRLPTLRTGVRAAWVVRTDIGSRAGVRRVVREARELGLTTIFVQVRGRGDAWYESELEPGPASRRLGFDPLQALLEEASAYGLRVHAWVNMALSGPLVLDRLPPGHAITRHPDWVQLPADAMDRLQDWERSAPRLWPERAAAWAQSHRNRVEGVYLDLGHPRVREHLVAVCEDLARRYPVQGIHLDYVRDPGRRWGFSPVSMQRFFDEHPRLFPAPVSAKKVLSEAPEAWARWRARGVDACVQQIRAALRALDPALMLTAAVKPTASRGVRDWHQDWPRWLEAGWIDVACPMNYAENREVFVRNCDEILRRIPRESVWMGQGAWRLSPGEIRRREAAGRDRGFAGTVLFSLGGLRESGALYNLGR